MDSRKGQGATEFMVLLAALFFFFVVMFVSINEVTYKKNIEKEQIFVRDLAYAVQDEFNLAFRATDGYTRSFNIPQTISGKDYNIQIIDNFIYINASKLGIALPVVNVTGEIIKGTNTIKKNGGVVYLN